MAVFNEPTQWGTSLVVNGDTNVIPQSTPAGSGALSFDDGFPQITQIPLGAGGIAPDRKDFNAVMKLLGDAVFYMQNGGFWSYNSAFDYAVGRVVLYNNKLYKCIQTNGPSSTVIDPSNGAYWQKILEDLDLINYANVDLSNLSATGQAKIEGFAEKDLSNITQVGKNSAISWLMPDLTTQTQVTAPYTAPSDGWLYIYLASTNNGGAVKVNGVYVFIHDIYGNSNIASTGFVPISKNDVITTNTNNSSFSLYFMKCKGAN